MSNRKQAELAVRQGLASVDDLAEYCGVSPATVHQWLYHGTAPRSFKVGRYRRFRWEDIESWLEDRSDGQPAA